MFIAIRSKQLASVGRRLREKKMAYDYKLTPSTLEEICFFFFYSHSQARTFSFSSLLFLSLRWIFFFVLFCLGLQFFFSHSISSISQGTFFFLFLFSLITTSKDCHLGCSWLRKILSFPNHHITLAKREKNGLFCNQYSFKSERETIDLMQCNGMKWNKIIRNVSFVDNDMK